VKKAKSFPPAGELRLSQVITTFGPGSMVDLPTHAILVGGLEFWRGNQRRIHEERLERRLCQHLQVENLALCEPPVDLEDPQAVTSGITGFVFPLWFLAMVDEDFVDVNLHRYRTRPLIPHTQLVEKKYLDEDRKKRPVVPVRFVQACARGHISDLDWHRFVHRDRKPSGTCQLWLDEGGAGNDFSDIFVRCGQCDGGRLRRPLSEALVPEARVLGTCSGRRPWLGPREWEPCDKPNRLLTRSASNAYFSQTLSVISIPDSEGRLKQAVDEVWEDFLQYAETPEDVPRDRRRAKVATALEGHSDDKVWAEIQRRRQGLAAETRGIKQAEIETLLEAPETPGPDSPDGDYYARAQDLEGVHDPFRRYLSKVVLVHRLREVIAQVGFTRFEAAFPDIDGELELDVEVAPLARDLQWLPAVENRGEGVFLAFSREAMEEWWNRPAVQERGKLLDQAFTLWKAQRNLPKARFPGLPYLMLHSLSHLLITAVSLDCGYSASAIRERVYAGESGYGILLYTGTPGSEGTLGGLVGVGRQLGRHLRRALELARLCSNDPVCAQHEPTSLEEARHLHGAACHGCLLIAETCCERRNELLDRALVVPTVATPEAAFFWDA